MFSRKVFGLIAISYWLLAIMGCSPKIKIGLWVKKHQDAALVLGGWAASNPASATALLNTDCTDRKQFKKKITDALHAAPTEQNAQQNYDVKRNNYHYGGAVSGNSDDGFTNWCRKYPKAAKKLRSHAKALCKTGLEVLSGIL